MAVDEVTPLRRVNHCKLIWLIQNVYQCRTLLKTCINGPDYGSKCASPFPWALKLGQSTNREQEGISLFIRGMNVPKDILVNFCVYVRKQTTLKPLLDEKYEAMFGCERIWESPLLATNNEFEVEPLKKKFCNFWEIHVELMWNEIIEPEIRLKKDPCDAVSKLLSFKELGTDLKQFFKNDRFSDIYIRCDNEEIPSHKAILEVRCPYFAQKIKSYSGGGPDISLSPPKDLDVMNAFLMYLYTGDIQSLMESGPLPIGLHKCAQRMKKYDLEWLTSPLQLCGYSHVTSELIKHEWIIDNFCKRFEGENESLTICSKSFGNDKTSFTIHVKLCKSKQSVDFISVFLQLDELAKGDCVYVIFDLSVNNGQKRVISKTTAGDMTKESSVGFSELVSIHNFLENPDARLACKISCSGGDLSTNVDKTSINCTIKPDRKAEVASPVVELGDGCHGWINLSYDLGQLLMTANYSDCTIVVGHDRLPAHRVLLAARSPYFSKIFIVKEEQCSGSSKGMEILVEDDIKISVEMMKIILEEIYTGSSKIQDSQSAKNIYNFAKFFGLRRLEIESMKYFENA